MRSINLVLCAFFLAAPTYGQEKSFSERLGNITVGKVKETQIQEMPVLTWGGDVPDMWANGGIITAADSIFARQGLKIKLVNGDDFNTQVRRYLEGDTPFLRGTFGMFAQASEVLNRDPKTKPVIILQKTWSKGDHVVAREKIKKLNDLKGTKGVLQRGGPHVELVNQMLKAAQLTWGDVEIVWVDSLTGEQGPANIFRGDESIDWCCVITPDMLGLVTPEGGVPGADGTVAGARTVLSTNEANHVIADLVAVRSDYFSVNRTEVAKYVAGYLRATEELLAAKKVYNDGKGESSTYINALKMAQGFYGADVLPTLEIDAHGFVNDADFARLPGNVSFFTEEGLVYGFAAKQKETLDLMVGLGQISKDHGQFDTAKWLWPDIAKMANIQYVQPKSTPRIAAESVDLFPDSNLDDQTIVSFTIFFEPNQQNFDLDTYASEFRRVVEQSQIFGNAVVVIRGHADPTKTLIDFLKAGMKKGLIRQLGSQAEGFSYYFQGKPMDLAQTAQVVEFIRMGSFAGTDPNPQDTMQAALNLSQVRAEQVRKSIVAFAQREGLKLDISQIQPSGVGIREPVIAKPKNREEAQQNMRVEFRLIRVPAESIQGNDFDLLK